MRDMQVTHYYHPTLEHAGAAVSKLQHSDPNTLSSMVQSFCHLWLETVAEEKKIKLITKWSAFTSYLTSLRLLFCYNIDKTFVSQVFYKG